MESVSVDAVSIPRGLMDYVQALIHRLELRYQGHRIINVSSYGNFDKVRLHDW